MIYINLHVHIYAYKHAHMGIHFIEDHLSIYSLSMGISDSFCLGNSRKRRTQTTTCPRLSQKQRCQLFLVHLCYFFTFGRCMHAWLIFLFFLGPTCTIDQVMSFDIRLPQWRVRLQLPLLVDLVIPMGFHMQKLCTAQLSLVKTWTSNISCLWAMGFAFLICPFARGKKLQLGLFLEGVFQKSILSETEWVESCACSKWVWHLTQ